MKTLIALVLFVLPSLSHAQTQPSTDKVRVFKIEGSSAEGAEKWVDQALGVVCYRTKDSIGKHDGNPNSLTSNLQCIKFR
jgi:hypothetical protein